MHQRPDRWVGGRFRAAGLPVPLYASKNPVVGAGIAGRGPASGRSVVSGAASMAWGRKSMSAPSPPTANALPRHMSELDGLRAIAVLCVCWHHWTPKRFHLGLNWGSTGVDLFFVLSGFLITSILLACRRPLEAGRQSVGFTARRFYARRFLRIFPLYYAVLGLATLALKLEPGILVSLWTYTFNLYGAWR